MDTNIGHPSQQDLNKNVSTIEDVRRFVVYFGTCLTARLTYELCQRSSERQIFERRKHKETLLEHIS